MKKEKFSYLYIYLFLLLCVISLIYYQSIKSKDINENFISEAIQKAQEDQKKEESKVNLSCVLEKDGKYNCTKYTPETIVKNVQVNYPPLKYDVGTGPSASSGMVKFKTKFESVPRVYCTPISTTIPIDPSTGKLLKKDDQNDIQSINITVFNVTESGFYYLKSKVSTKKEFNGLTSLGKDDQSIFSWLAMTEPPKNPSESLEKPKIT